MKLAPTNAVNHYVCSLMQSDKQESLLVLTLIANCQESLKKVRYRFLRAHRKRNPDFHHSINPGTEQLYCRLRHHGGDSNCICLAKQL